MAFCEFVLNNKNAHGLKHSLVFFTPLRKRVLRILNDLRRALKVSWRASLGVERVPEAALGGLLQDALGLRSPFYQVASSSSAHRAFGMCPNPSTLLRRAYLLTHNSRLLYVEIPLLDIKSHDFVRECVEPLTAIRDKIIA
jgi:hypothetical protein